MWNLKSINPICQKKKTTEDQQKLILNIQCAKKRIDNGQPWQPSHSLSKWTNKYTHQTEEKIMYQNNVLLNKMMEIQKSNLANVGQFNKFPVVAQQQSIVEGQRKKEKIKIQEENQKFLKRLQSANSIYGKKFWYLDDEKNKKYKENILRKTRVDGDYTEIAKRNLSSQKSSRMQIKSQAVFKGTREGEDQII